PDTSAVAGRVLHDLSQRGERLAVVVVPGGDIAPVGTWTSVAATGDEERRRPCFIEMAGPLRGPCRDRCLESPRISIAKGHALVRAAPPRDVLVTLNDVDVPVVGDIDRSEGRPTRRPDERSAIWDRRILRATGDEGRTLP